MFKYFRRQAGLSAPRLSIRPEWPLHWRIASVVVLSAAALALAGWIYDAGRQFAGFHQSESGEQLDSLRQQVAALTSELESIRGIADSSVARLQVENTAQEHLASLVKSLEEENAKLKAELAVFENLAGNEHVVPGLAISRFDVRPDGELGTYRFNLLVTKVGGNNDRSFKGKLELLVNTQQGSHVDIITLPGKEANPLYQLQFRYFKRVDGQFKVPMGTKLVSVEARLFEDGQMRVSQVTRIPANGGK